MANETAGARHRGVQGRGIQMKSSAAFAKGIGGSITLYRGFEPDRAPYQGQLVAITSELFADNEAPFTRFDLWRVSPELDGCDKLEAQSLVDLV
jgi:hypothetical protein